MVRERAVQGLRVGERAHEMTLGWGALRAAARAAAAFVASRASFIVHAHRQAWMDAAASRIYRRLPGSGRALVPRMPGPCARCRAGRPPPDGDGEPQPSWTELADGARAGRRATETGRGPGARSYITP